jgi:hypothetical protein
MHHKFYKRAKVNYYPLWENFKIGIRLGNNSIED